MAKLSDRRCASVRALQQIKDVMPADAAAIRKAWRTIPNRREARDAINVILKTYGVEFLGINKRSNGSVYYCNAGDTYATTILFEDLRMWIGCCGDTVERDAIREARMHDRD